jgi:hypothetical protein
MLSVSLQAAVDGFHTVAAFTTSEAGSHQFTVTFNTSQAIVAQDTSSSTITAGAAATLVTAITPEQMLFGDLSDPDDVRLLSPPRGTFHRRQACYNCKVGAAHFASSAFTGLVMRSSTPKFTDKKARLILPARFANSAVLIEEVSDTELRVRKAAILPEDELPFTEEYRRPLADEDRDFVLALLANPPKANAALKKAAREYRRGHG